MFGDEPFNHARMGLMRAYHIRKGDLMIQPALNEQHPSPAYHCGRLMALLARIQYAALGDVGAGVVQRYYAAASTTPALVLGRLSRTAQFHLGKLDAGLARWFESRLASIWTCLRDGPPTVLGLEEQSLFALGYYQQIAADRAEHGGNVKNDATEVNNV
jgi:CRISPR-associated protein Csd1